MRIVGHPLFRLTAGFAIWAVAFVVIYSFLSIGCDVGLQHVELMRGVTLQRLLLSILTIGFFALSYATLRFLKPRHRTGTIGFVDAVGYRGAMAGLVSGIFTFAAVFVLSSC